MLSRFVQLLAAVPVVLAGAVEYPEVIPGPGLPSLESLGLTSEQLWTMPQKRSANGNLATRYNMFCGPEKAYTHCDDLRACANYLSNLGDHACVVDSNQSIIMCSTGSSSIFGTSIVGHETQSTCFNVARGFHDVIDRCQRGGDCGGSAPAYGNGDMMVFGAPTNFYN